MQLKDFNETFADDLRDSEFVEGLLQEALQLDTATFLMALKNVVKANGGMTQLAGAIKRSRESMYRTLSEQGNPQFETIRGILAAYGMRLTVSRTDESASDESSPRSRQSRRKVPARSPALRGTTP